MLLPVLKRFILPVQVTSRKAQDLKTNLPMHDAGYKEKKLYQTGLAPVMQKASVSDNNKEYLD